jgi:hypothetical protein
MTGAIVVERAFEVAEPGSYARERASELITAFALGRKRPLKVL